MSAAASAWDWTAKHRVWSEWWVPSRVVWKWPERVVSGAVRRGQCGVGRTEDHVIGEIIRLARMTTDEQPVLPGRLLQAHQAHPRPIVEPLAFGAGAGRERLPRFCR